MIFKEIYFGFCDIFANHLHFWSQLIWWSFGKWIIQLCKFIYFISGIQTWIEFSTCWGCKSKQPWNSSQSFEHHNKGQKQENQIQRQLNQSKSMEVGLIDYKWPSFLSRSWRQFIKNWWSSGWEQTPSW